MWNVIARHKKGIIAKDIDEGALIQSANLNSVVVQLQSISEKIGADQMDTLLKNIFKNCIVLKTIELHKCMKSLEEIIIDLTDLDIFTTEFEERTGKFGQSQITYYTRGAFMC